MEDTANVIKKLLQNNVKGQSKYIHTNELETKGLTKILKKAYNKFITLTHPSFTKNVIRHLAYNLSLSYPKNKCPLKYFFKKETIVDLRTRLKQVLKNWSATQQIDNIWDELGLPMSSLYGFKEKMRNDDFDFEKNCSWILEN